MLPYLKKDFLIYWRDRKEMLAVIFGPVLMIIVLSLALPHMVVGDDAAVEAKIAVVNQDDAEAGMQRFATALASRQLPDEEADALAAGAEELQPASILLDVFRSVEVSALLEVVETDEASAMEMLQAAKVDAVLTIPPGYTEDVLLRLLLNEGEGAALTLAANDSSLQLDVLETVVGSVLETVNLHAALVHAAEDPLAVWQRLDQLETEVGGAEQVTGIRSVTASQYYTAAVSLLFAMFVAMTTAMLSAAEKRERVIHRILLTGGKPLLFLAGKAGASFLMVMLQMSISLLVPHFILSVFAVVPESFWGGLVWIYGIYGLVTAGLAVLFTSLMHRLKDADGILLVVTIMFGTIGGGFVPIYVLPEWLRKVGEWSPNGMALSAALQWIQAGEWELLLIPSVHLLLYSLLLFAAGWACFPRRGQI